MKNDIYSKLANLNFLGFYCHDANYKMAETRQTPHTKNKQKKKRHAK